MALNVIERAFDEVRHDGENRYFTAVGSDFRMGEFLFGGFAAALVRYVASRHFTATHRESSALRVTSLQVRFLETISRDEMMLEVGRVKSTKTVESLRIVLSQKNSIKLAADVSIATSTPQGWPTINEIFHLSPPPTPVDLDKLERNIDTNWVRYHIPYSKSSSAIPESHWHRCLDRAGPRNPRIHDNWVSLSEPGARITNALVPFIVDMPTRMVYNFEESSDFSYKKMVQRAERSVNGSVRQEDLEKLVMKVWPATQSMSVEIVRQLPPEGVRWVFLRGEAKVLNDGKLVVDVTILDEKLELVAVAQSVDLVIPGRSRAKGYKGTSEGARIWKI